MREERLGAVHDAPEVDANQPLEVFVANLLHGAAERDSGVVEDEVDLAMVAHDLVCPGVDGVAVGDVHALRSHPDSELSRFRHRLL